MELNELERRLVPFCQDKYQRSDLQIRDVHKMPGHAGFAYGFSVENSSTNTVDKWYLRLPPPDVKLQGTADVLRQVAALNALPTTVPHCKVSWSGDEAEWFGRPYFVVPQLEGNVVQLDGTGWVTKLDEPAREEMARQAVSALATIHKVDWHKVSYLGEPLALSEDVTRWDRFIEKVAEPQLLELQPTVRELLLEKIPQDAPMGIFHGDFQWSNLFFADKGVNTGTLLAVIDWELVGVGATLNDVGWFATFNDPLAWSDSWKRGQYMPQADALIEMYTEAWGSDIPDINWYRALAAYKFSIITGFNLMLHRRGKRHDPMWETTKDSMPSLLSRARSLLR